MNTEYEHFGYPIMYPLSDMNVPYLDKIQSCVENAIKETPRIYAVRVDLRIPDYDIDDLRRDEIISCIPHLHNLEKRFIDSLNEKIKALDKRKLKQGKRVHRSKFKYIWVRERDKADNDHYHFVLMFNRDRFYRLGDFHDSDSLAYLIRSAWLSALKLSQTGNFGLVHFSRNGCFNLMINDNEFDSEFKRFFHRVSYLAKKRTKNYGEGKRNFGCSQR